MIYDDEKSLGDLVDRMSQHYEAAVGSDWRFEPERENHRSQLRGIVGFVFAPKRIDLKFMLNQSLFRLSEPASRQSRGRSAAFERSGDPGAAQLAAWMAEREPDDPSA